jgi:hypothetical protein
MLPYDTTSSRRPRLDTLTRQHSSSTNCIYSASFILHTRLSPRNDTIRLAASVDPVWMTGHVYKPRRASCRGRRFSANQSSLFLLFSARLEDFRRSFDFFSFWPNDLERFTAPPCRLASPSSRLDSISSPSFLLLLDLARALGPSGRQSLLKATTWTTEPRPTDPTRLQQIYLLSELDSAERTHSASTRRFALTIVTSRHLHQGPMPSVLHTEQGTRCVPSHLDTWNVHLVVQSSPLAHLRNNHDSCRMKGMIYQ